MLLLHDLQRVNPLCLYPQKDRRHRIVEVSDVILGGVGCTGEYRHDVQQIDKVRKRHRWNVRFYLVREDVNRLVDVNVFLVLCAGMAEVIKNADDTVCQLNGNTLGLRFSVQIHAAFMSLVMAVRICPVAHLTICHWAHIPHERSASAVFFESLRPFGMDKGKHLAVWTFFFPPFMRNGIRMDFVDEVVQFHSYSSFSCTRSNGSSNVSSNPISS